MTEPVPHTTARVLPSGIVLSVAENETVMAAAHRAGYYWPTICGGHARCARCVMEIEDGAEAMSEASDEERSTLRKIRGAFRPESERLACQTTLRADVTVRRRGVRPQEPRNQQ
ncbi:2Fe-2S iron-sulfur cluster-binding protein [Dietzia lutea]|uniref:2Fe-2S iron-sulfur cluster-binding protein n=1 Tax=Dietzia lutea TaxID=546160 RepID=UPI00399B174A